MRDPNNWVDILGLAGKIPTQTPGDTGVSPVSGGRPSDIELQQRASDLQSILPDSSQGYKTTAVGYATDAKGNGYIIAASSDTNLSPSQRSALDPASGELRASGSGHAEMTIADYCQSNDLTLEAIAASRPVCESCQARLDEDGVEIVSERKNTLCNK